MRFSMAMLELSEARDSFFRVLLLAALALLASVFALLSMSGMIVALTWEALGWRIFLILFLVYLLLTVAMVWKARNLIASGRIGLPATLAELKKDRAALFDGLRDQDGSA